MTINDSLDRAQKGLLDFFFPRKCPFCGRMTGRELLCSRCKTELPRCDKLRTGSFGECAAPLYYEGAVREAILSFKFKGRLEVLECFGSLMAQVDRLCRDRHLRAADQVAIHKMRRDSNRTSEPLYPDDVAADCRALALFVSAVFGEGIPHTLTSLLPHGTSTPR